MYDGARRSNAACEINVKSRREIEGWAGKSKRRASDAKRPASDARGWWIAEPLRNQAIGGKATIICAAIYALEQGKLLRNRIVIIEALGRLFIVVDGKTGTGSSVAGRYKAGRV